jgi:hypothetical protein
MTKKVVESKQPLSGVDLLWDGWLNNFKTLQGFQSELEEKSLQAVEYQKQFLDSTEKTLRRMEEESSKVTQVWSEQLQSSVQVASSNQDQLISDWKNKIDEINNNVQSLSWNPSHTLLELFTQSQVQLEETVKEALKQQRNGRSEILKTIENLTEQAKQTHKSILASVNS